MYAIYYQVLGCHHCAGFSVQQRPHREDLELSLWVLERLLCLLPQLFARRWQCNSLTHVFRKLLHHANTLRLRREGIRCVRPSDRMPSFSSFPLCNQCLLVEFLTLVTSWLSNTVAWPECRAGQKAQTPQHPRVGGAWKNNGPNNPNICALDKWL